MAEIKIRHEKKEDYTNVEKVTRDAFWNLYVPGCNEHLIIHNLRNHEDYIPELTFVIEVDGRIAGSIFYSKTRILDDSGKEISQVITFGPVSIAPEFHNMGLGSKLINYSIEEAKKLGYKAIIIGGYPAYYERFGFTGTKKFGLSLEDGNYYSGIMALELVPNALSDIKGQIQFSSALEPDANELEEFDAQFPHKEKKVTSSQEKFAKAASELDTKEY
ncbi:GNAT family N-acetyltransferase [Floricoccus tropicus]|uniref:GNAT family N-acetyltransferase n=1 Tax=Floricoccus tropicus TaxID=1859473 RepID=A0A1E8GQ72_9LACT|nr:N-acetyltransferase [Floricoccus tropicus]OFI50367.1 GNAT family N-acetyltransferase [Floricoccus tropicus]